MKVLGMNVALSEVKTGVNTTTGKEWRKIDVTVDGTPMLTLWGKEKSVLVVGKGVVKYYKFTASKSKKTGLPLKIWFNNVPEDAIVTSTSKAGTQYQEIPVTEIPAGVNAKCFPGKNGKASLEIEVTIK